MDVSYIPIAKARDFTTHSDKKNAHLIRKGRSPGNVLFAYLTSFLISPS